MTISKRHLRPIQRSPSVTSPCSLFHVAGNDASPDLSTEVAAEPERERTPDNRPVVGLIRGERVGGTDGDEDDVHGVGERTVGINSRNVEPEPALDLAMAREPVLRSECSASQQM